MVVLLLPMRVLAIGRSKKNIHFFGKSRFLPFGKSRFLLNPFGKSKFLLIPDGQSKTASLFSAITSSASQLRIGQIGSYTINVFLCLNKSIISSQLSQNDLLEIVPLEFSTVPVER